jgi:hypothetical protein
MITTETIRKALQCDGHSAAISLVAWCIARLTLILHLLYR